MYAVMKWCSVKYKVSDTSTIHPSASSVGVSDNGKVQHMEGRLERVVLVVLLDWDGLQEKVADATIASAWEQSVSRAARVFEFDKWIASCFLSLKWTKGMCSSWLNLRGHI